MLGLRGRHRYSDQRCNRNRVPCVASTAVGTDGGGGPNGQVVSVKTAADGRSQKSRKMIDKKREKEQGQEHILVEHLDGLEKNDFVILINHASAPIRRERLSSTSKARREASRNESWRRAGCQIESKALEISMVERTVREPALGLLNPFEMD